MNEDKRRKIISSIVVGLVLIALIGLAIYFMPLLRQLGTAEGREAFEAYIKSMGIKGALVMLGIQVLQIVVAVLPGEPIELIAGYLYGTFGGLLLCEIGILIGSVIVFFLGRLLKMRFITLFIPREKLESYRFLQNETRLEGIIALLFFIPGTPKDVLTYIVPLTPIKPLRFFLIALFARIPSVITSTWAGATLSEGNWVQSLIIFGCTAVIGLIGILAHRKILAHREKNAEARQD